MIPWSHMCGLELRLALGPEASLTVGSISSSSMNGLFLFNPSFGTSIYSSVRYRGVPPPHDSWLRKTIHTYMLQASKLTPLPLN